jgi:hypothetical protein
MLAAKAGHLHVLIRAHDHSCQVGTSTYACAAWGGHLDVLKWLLREHHCPWDERTCTMAAAGGHLDVLKWAQKYHCPWDEGTCMRAAEAWHLQVLRWAMEHSAPVHPHQSQWYDFILFQADHF